MISLRRLKSETGQAIVLTTIAMVVIMAMSAFVIDLGIDFRTKRKLQATADAAALAGAQELPGNATAAQVLAQSYADRNGGNVESISIQSKFNPSDTIEVKTKKNEPSIFGRAIGIGGTDIHASAKARVDVPQSALHVAPMVVHCNHPLIQNCGGGGSASIKFNVNTTLDYDPMGAPGAFGMLNLNDKGGTPGSSEQADWILKGWNKYMDVNRNYKSNPGAKFSSEEIQGALETRMNSADPVLLFPVFERLTGTGSNADYYIIGWIGFHLTSFEVHGNNAALHGYFTTYIAQGVLASSGSGSTNFGVKSIQLIE
jgi:Flp pilus assembly protein TadG